MSDNLPTPSPEPSGEIVLYQTGHGTPSRSPEECYNKLAAVDRPTPTMGGKRVRPDLHEFGDRPAPRHAP